MESPVARLNDTVTGTCNGGGHSSRTFTGHWVTCSSTVKANELGVVRLGDTGTTDCGHTFVASTASLNVTADGIHVHRVGDEVIVLEGGNGHTVTGSPTVFAD